MHYDQGITLRWGARELSIKLAEQNPGNSDIAIGQPSLDAFDELANQNCVMDQPSASLATGNNSQSAAVPLQPSILTSAKKWKKKGRKSLVRFIRDVSDLPKKQAAYLADYLLGEQAINPNQPVNAPCNDSADSDSADNDVAISERASCCQANSNETDGSDDFRKQLQLQKMQALQQLAYGASHEINNPLANIATRAQTLMARTEELESRQKLAVIYEQAMRAHEMISDLMLFANPPPLNRQSIQLRYWLPQLIRQVEPWLHTPTEILFGQGNQKGNRGGSWTGDISEKKQLTPHPSTAKSVIFRTIIAPGTDRITADRTQLSILLMALIRNSIESIRGGGKPGWIELRISRQQDGRWLFAVTDDGPGIPPQIRDFIFNPFFSGREAGRGLGFGLPKAWRIAQSHGGELILNQDQTAGTQFQLLLPDLPPSPVNPTDKLSDEILAGQFAMPVEGAVPPQGVRGETTAEGCRFYPLENENEKLKLNMVSSIYA